MRSNHLPALTEIHRSGKDDGLKRCVQRVNTMIEQFSQWPALLRSPRLRAIDSIKRLVQEQANGPAGIHPRRAVLIESRRVPQEGKEVCDDETKSAKCDLKAGDELEIRASCSRCDANSQGLV